MVDQNRVKSFPVFICWPFKLLLCQKFFFQKVHGLVVIYTPKEAHSWIFVTGGSLIGNRVTNVGPDFFLFLNLGELQLVVLVEESQSVSL